MSDLASQSQSPTSPITEVQVQSVQRPTPRPRVWPGVVIIALQWLCALAPKWLAPDEIMLQFVGLFLAPMVGAGLIVIWWVFFSRIRWRERWLLLLAANVIGGVMFALGHSSFNAFGLIMYTLPAVTTAWVLWLLVTPFLAWPFRRAGLLAVFVLGFGYFTLVRFDGVFGNFNAELSYRWTPTEEEKAAAERAARRNEAAAPGNEVLVLQPGDWPGFRGPERDGKLHGVRIATDWDQRPPKRVWKQRVGPGWSSFAVVGHRLYTQEQWGEEEVVACYHTDTGKELWVHKDADTRFTELVGGPGPRATPTFHDSKLYVQGAKGRLNCLDAATGKLLWSRDITQDSGAKEPTWGFAASPLVARGIVMVYAGAQGKCVLGYHADTGEPAWAAGAGGLSYCSLHPARLGGVEQALIATDKGLISFEPAKGDVLWHHDWEADMQRVAQPALLNDSDVLLPGGLKLGMRRLKVSHGESGWTDEAMWTSRAIKPYYNDLVVYRDHLYGFDGEFFACVDIDKGNRRWKTRGYGNGQVLLLADQGLLLILSEQGEVALVEATPQEHKELTRFQAIEGKTWNHPVIAHGKLFVRNSAEMACFEVENK
jgi:outer membrane protein assembly factor BamB